MDNEKSERKIFSDPVDALQYYLDIGFITAYSDKKLLQSSTIPECKKDCERLVSLIDESQLIRVLIRSKYSLDDIFLLGFYRLSFYMFVAHDRDSSYEGFNPEDILNACKTKCKDKGKRFSEILKANEEDGEYSYLFNKTYDLAEKNLEDIHSGIKGYILIASIIALVSGFGGIFNFIKFVVIFIVIYFIIVFLIKNYYLSDAQILGRIKEIK